jgi:hypothetical protein
VLNGIQFVNMNSVASVRVRTVSTERPPLVGVVGANFCGWRVKHGQRDGSLRMYSGLSRPELLLSLSSSSSVDPVPDPLLYGGSGGSGNRARASGSVASNSDHGNINVVNCIVNFQKH